jgi:phage terminase small subunit
MTGIARQEWIRTTDQLRVMGILSMSDQSMLEVYCVTYAEWRAVKKDGGSGLRYVTTLKQLQREFGLSPSSRSSINLELAADESQNPFLQLAKINDAS